MKTKKKKVRRKRKKKKLLPAYQYDVELRRVIDGDTFDFSIDLGFDVAAKARIRLLGLDTPESRGKGKCEKGLVVKEHVRDMLFNAKKIIMNTRKKGKFGRYLAIVWIDDVELNAYLLKNKLAKPYFGGKR